MSGTHAPTLLIAAILLLTGCASTRSELSVEVRSQEERPEYVVAFRIQN